MAGRKPPSPPTRTGEFVLIEGQHVKLSRSGVLKLGPLSINFHHPSAGGVLGMEAHCCKGDFGACVLRKAGENCADTDRPITVWYFTE